MFLFIIRLFICINILFAYYKQDPIMIALSGAYNTVAQGYQSVGINPANLSFANGTSVGLFNMNLNMMITSEAMRKEQGKNASKLFNDKFTVRVAALQICNHFI